jgi:anti-anti-sigma factor
VSGEIDMAVADQLVDMVLDEPPRQDDTIILDLAEVTFCDSSGINALIRLQHHQADAGHTMRVINAATAVRRVFELAGVVHYLKVEDSPPTSRHAPTPKATGPHARGGPLQHSARSPLHAALKLRPPAGRLVSAVRCA